MVWALSLSAFQVAEAASIHLKKKTVKVFEYLGSMFAAEEGSETDVNNRVKAAWTKLREVSGVMSDKRLYIKLQYKTYIIKPAMIHTSRRWAVKKHDIQTLHTTTRSKTNNDYIKNVDVWGESNIEQMTTFLGKRRLRWYIYMMWHNFRV